jgi:hypothetical protein
MMQAYWAAKEARETVAESITRIDGWFEYVRNSGLLSLWRRSLEEYYAGAEEGGSTGVAGDSEELTTVKVNHVRNLGEHLVSAIAGQAPQFLPQGSNNDHVSANAVRIDGALLDDAIKHGALGKIRIEASRRSHVLSEGWASVLWDSTLGEAVAPDPTTQQLVNTGDVLYALHSPIDVARDPHRDDNAHKWYLVRRAVNRWDLAAQHPEFADEIDGLPSKLEERELRPRLVHGALLKQQESEEVYVYDLWHDRTPAMPQGRQLTFATETAFWGDGPLKYDRMPMFCLSAETQIGTCRGYSTAFDLLPLQQVINACYSVSLTNVNAFGVQSIWTQPGSNIDIQELTKGLNHVKSTTKPEPLNLAQTAPEVPALAANLIQQSEILSGVNAVRRGNIEATGKLSGAAYALLDAKLLDLTVSQQDAYRTWLTDIALHVTRLFQKFATVERIIQIAGLSNRSEAITFKGEDLKPIRRVEIELGNALQRTTAGRLQLAEMLADRQMLKTPEAFISVVTTGRHEPVTEGPSKEYNNVKAENEWLGDGKVPLVLRIDNHSMHIAEHAGVLASPETRNNPQIVQSVLQHISEHEALMAPPVPMGPDGQPLPPPGPGGGPEVSANPPVQGPPGAAGSGEQIAGLPSMPTNPGTGEPAPNPGG